VVRTRLTRAQSRARTRDLLIDAAMQIVARDGYAGASVDAIAAQAGFSMGAVYSNFATKEELFLAAFERHCASELGALAALVEAHPDREELLTAVVERFADLGEQHRQWWTLWAELWLYAQRHPHGAARLAEVQAQTQAVLAGALRRTARADRGAGRGHPRPVDRVHAGPPGQPAGAPPRGHSQRRCVR